MGVSILGLNSMCVKLNGILENLEKPYQWSYDAGGDTIILLCKNTNSETTQYIFQSNSIQECFNYLTGYYLGLRHLSMLV
ncbi:hypothetical protein [Pedobacter miscanthi]|uniref:Uncharacterized protein n=1 Tax=Pedobacter miscanthi TaxID=2259170 RepID=A0A366KNQ7_9SPHI|nr:hypothetical protein [Pedobacter miscanthi]RBQ02819.1 hypothetical protein DRW42_24525 [Pedobacter miscanthi]